MRRRSFLGVVASAFGGGVLGYTGGRKGRTAPEESLASISSAAVPPPVDAAPETGFPAIDVRSFREGMGQGNASADTEGFRLALSHLEQNGFGDLAFRGHFRIGETLTVARGVGLLGSGIPDASLRWEGAAAAPVIRAGKDAQQFNSNIRIRNFSLRNLDGSATWALHATKTAFGCSFAWLNIGVTPFQEGGIELSAGCIVNYLEHLRIERQPCAIRLGPRCNGCWIRGGHLYGNTVGIDAPNELSALGIADMNLEDHERHAIRAIGIRGIELSGLRLEDNYPGPGDASSAQIHLESCSGIWRGGYVAGDMRSVAARPRYAARLVNSRKFLISGVSERWHGVASVTADQASRGWVVVDPSQLETPVDPANVLVLGRAYVTRVRRSTPAAVPPGREQPVAMEAADADSQDGWNPGASRSRVEVRFDGVYRIRGTAEWAAGAGTVRRIGLRIYPQRGARRQARSGVETSSVPSPVGVAATVEYTTKLNSRQSVELWASHDAGVPVVIQSASLMLERLGD